MPAIVRRTSPPRGEPIRCLSANSHQKKRQAQAVTDDAPLVKRSMISRKRISFRHHLPLVERKMISAHGLVVEWRTRSRSAAPSSLRSWVSDLPLLAIRKVKARDDRRPEPQKTLPQSCGSGRMSCTGDPRYGTSASPRALGWPAANTGPLSIKAATGGSRLGCAAGRN
jgi:hypothetical protein